MLKNLARPIQGTGRGLLGVGALALAMLGAVLHPGHVLAGYTVCEGDPIVKLSDGAHFHIHISVGDGSDSIGSIVYTIHAPTGVAISHVVATGGSLKGKEAVELVQDQPAGSYLVDTQVTVTNGQAPIASTVTLNTPGTTPLSDTETGLSGADLISQFSL